MSALLDVHLYGHRVAELLEAGQGEVAVAYTAEALTAGAPARLSLALPVRAEPYPSRHGGQRFQGLVTNELFGLRLARAVGLSAAEAVGGWSWPTVRRDRSGAS